MERKWHRNDVMTFAEKHTGIRREDVWLDELRMKDGKPGRKLKAEVVDGIALYLEEVVSEILDGEEPDIEEPLIRQRPDGMTGKMREIALLDITHQLLEHLTFILLEPLMGASILQTQHASIPGRGQTALKKQVQKCLRRKRDGVIYAQKTDCTKAYASTKYEFVLKLLGRDIPSAHHILKIVAYLGKLAPGGGLIIGGYLDAWLFNYVMSKAIREAYKSGRTRRGKFQRNAKRIITFMDDALFLTSSIKAMKAAIKTFTEYMAKAGIKARTTTGIMKILPIEEEQRRKHLHSKAARGCPAIDMAGFKICRSHVTIRRRIFLRVRRNIMRGWRELKRTGTINTRRAFALASYNGWIRNSDSNGLMSKYDVQDLMRAVGRAVSREQKEITRKREVYLRDLQRRREQREAG